MQGGCQHLCTLNTKVDPTVLDAGNGGLRDTAERRKLRLAKALQLANDPHRFAWTDVDALLGGNKFSHLSVSGSHVV